MTNPGARKILEKALARGIISAGVAHETMRRLGEAAARGASADVIDVLRDVGKLDPRMLAGLDDRSLVGRTLGGFEVGKKIGEGGMGAVHRATQLSLGREVALKILDPSLSCRADVAARFRREARVAARLDHPHVVQPIDFGEDAGFVYFAMELMEGGSAAARITSARRYSEAESIEVGASIARALDYAAERGIVHRDLKPDNILFSKHGAAKLADLGLVLDIENQERLTEPGIAMGTPHYMSPEQAMGQRDLDVRSDIYSLGATLFEMISGRTVFEGPSAASILGQHVSAPPPDIRALAPQVSVGFATVMARMLEKKRDARYPTAGSLVLALESLKRAHLAPDGATTEPRIAKKSAAKAEEAAAREAAPGARREAETPEAAPELEREPTDAALAPAAAPGAKPPARPEGKAAKGEAARAREAAPGARREAETPRAAPELEREPTDAALAPAAAGEAIGEGSAKTGPPQAPADTPVAAPLRGAPPELPSSSRKLAAPAAEPKSSAPERPPAGVATPAAGSSSADGGAPARKPAPPPLAPDMTSRGALAAATVSGATRALAAKAPAGAEAGRRRAPVAVLAVAALAVAVVAGLAWRGRTSAAPRIDAAAEDDAVRDLRDQLLARRAADNAYGYDYRSPSDPWTTAQAYSALAIAREPPPEELLGAFLARVRALKLIGDPPQGGGWPVMPSDDSGAVEATTWVAFAGAIDGEDGRDLREQARAWLLHAEQPDGGIPDLPATGARGVRTSGTAMGLAALAEIEAAEAATHPSVVDAARAEPLERAARWLGEHYERGQHLWFPNPTPAYGNREPVPGLSEFCSWALLEASAAGVKLPDVARAALEDFAATHASVDVAKLDTLGVANTNDYVFGELLPPGVRATLPGVRWVAYAWRLIACTRIGASDLPRASDWAAEATRLRARAPELRRALDPAPTFEVAECLFAVNLCRATPATERGAASLVAALRARRKAPPSK